MNVVICTSAVTYVPNNYDIVLQEILTQHRNTIVGVIVVHVPVRVQFFGVCKLLFTGCYRMTLQVVRNIFTQKRKLRICRTLDIPIHHTNNPNSAHTQTWLRELDVHLLVHMRTRVIFKETLLSLPRFGCVNVHHGLLPAQRGLMADLHALARGSCTGISIHLMETKIDAGPIYATVPVLSNTKRYLEYLRELETCEIRIIHDFLHTLEMEGALPAPINHAKQRVSYTHEPSYSEIRSFIHGGMKL